MSTPPDLMRESQAMLEYFALRRAPVFSGKDLPRGRGQLVLVLPGMFGNDFYLQPLREWLGRLGYEPALSMLTVNAGCPKRLLGDVERAFRPRFDQHTGDVAIIGHSRGGMLGKALASRLGPRVTRFIAIGSPVGAMLRLGPEGMAEAFNTSPDSTPNPAADNVAHRKVVEAGRAAMRFLDPDCDSPMCGCEYIADLLQPLPATTRITTIYSTNDPIVPPSSCPILAANNIEVTGTHSGLVFNQQVYPHIAEALAG